jgi:hypothetical protein
MPDTIAILYDASLRVGMVAPFVLWVDFMFLCKSLKSGKKSVSL